MESISLLWENRDAKLKAGIVSVIPNSVFTDMKIKEIFSQEEIEIFLHYARMISSRNTIIYRQQIIKDIFENEEIYKFLKYFNDELRKVKRSYELLDKTNEIIVRYGIFAEFLNTYQNFIEDIYKKSKKLEFNSEGLKSFLDFIDKQYNSKKYKEAEESIGNLKNNYKENLNAEITVNALNGIYVAYRLEQQTKGENLIDRLCRISNAMGIDMDNIVSRLGKQELFNKNMLNVYKDRNSDYIDNLKIIYENFRNYVNIEIFELIEETEFYFVMCKFYKYLESLGVDFCIPNISNNRNIYMENVFDLTLLHKIEFSKIVFNDCDFSDEERFFIMTGVNSGGKTTYVRALGIAMLLFNAGGYICAKKAVMPVVDMIYTHFPVEEGFDKTGRLEEEKMRVDEILKNITENSFVLLNETYSSTYESLSLELSLDLIEKLQKSRAFAIYVTHNHTIEVNIKETENFKNIKYLVPQIDEEEKSTYKILKSDTGEKSHADTVIFKYGLTKAQLLSKLRERGEEI